MENMGHSGKRGRRTCGRFQPSSVWLSAPHPPTCHILKEGEGESAAKEGLLPVTASRMSSPTSSMSPFPCGGQTQGALCKISSFREGQAPQTLPTGTGSWRLSNHWDWDLAS